MTENFGAVKDVLKRLQPGCVQPGGTDLGAGLDAAIEAFGEEEHIEGRAIVVFSDGEDHADRWRSRLDRLIGAGVMVHVVAIGDPDKGHPVPSGTPQRPLTYEGKEVLSQRVDTALQAIALQTGGATLKLGLAPANLGALYGAQIGPVASRKRAAMRIPERPERFPLFLAAAFGFVLAGSRPPGRMSLWRWVQSRSLGILLLSEFFLASLGAAQDQEGLVSGSQPSEAAQQAAGVDSPPAAGETAAALVSRGQTAYRSGKMEEALAAFEAAIERAPGEPIPLYNAAAALFQLKQYPQALLRYREARTRADSPLQTKIDFALGNTALALGDLPGAIESYDLCLASTTIGSELDQVRRDAAINRRYALEQAQSTLASQDEDERDQPSAKQPRHSRGSQKRSNGGDEPAPDDEAGSGSGGQSPSAQGDGENRPPSSRKRTGGAGGASNTPSAAPSQSPDARLDSALQQVREAEERRLPEEAPAEPSGDDRKDW
jgi:Ca-activated chloride channel family protein